MVHLEICFYRSFQLEKPASFKTRMALCQDDRNKITEKQKGRVTLVQTVMMCYNVASLSNLLGYPNMSFHGFMQSAAKT